MKLHDFILVPRTLPTQLAPELFGQDAHQHLTAYDFAINYLAENGNACALSLPSQPLKPSELTLNGFYVVEYDGKMHLCQLVNMHDNVITAEIYAFAFLIVGSTRLINVSVNDENGELIDTLDRNVWELAQCK